jgi:succinate-acetate transporter protein
MQASSFFSLAAGAFIGNINIHHVGGYLGLLTAVLALYLAAAEIINETWARTVLPIGAP